MLVPKLGLSTNLKFQDNKKGATTSFVLAPAPWMPSVFFSIAWLPLSCLWVT